MRISVIIPAHNEEASIALVLQKLDENLVGEVIVVDNDSSDQTAAVARAQGARVVFEPGRGYGRACLAGMAELSDPDVVVFLDADYSDFPERLDEVVKPIAAGEADFVIGSRVLGNAEKGSLTPVQRYGNWLATTLLNALFKTRYTDLGPFRAIKYNALKKLRMRDKKYGWTVEMQIKAALWGLEIIEVPVPYRKRVGTSKISGTVKGVVLASVTILSYLFGAALYRLCVVPFKRQARQPDG